MRLRDRDWATIIIVVIILTVVTVTIITDRNHRLQEENERLQKEVVFLQKAVIVNLISIYDALPRLSGVAYTEVGR